MQPEFSIKLGFVPNRNNPDELFYAMGDYIKACRAYNQLMANAIGLQVDFNFQLTDIEKSSILSRLKSCTEKLDYVTQNILFKSGNETFQKIKGIEDTETEEQVENIATLLESTLNDNLESPLNYPYVDRQVLSYVLNSFSIANEKVQAGESVLLSTSGYNNDKTEVNLNTRWRFTGNPKEMFLGTSKKVNTTLKLYATKTVNKGESQWEFKSDKLPKVFTAKILHKEWLEEYQHGLIPAIGVYDVLDVSIAYEIYTPPKGKGNSIIRSAVIKQVIKIERNTGYQHELDT
jgi:hypothetical protein